MSKVQSAVFALVLGLVILAHGVLRADTPYQIQPIVKLGDRVGDAGIKTTDGYFEIGTLNDSGQLVFITENEAGGQLLIQSAAGKLTPIVARDGAAPGGKWSADVRVREPVSMNQFGNAVFAAFVTLGEEETTAVFRWDYQAQQIAPVALPGMPALNNLLFESVGDDAPVINNRNEIALVAQVNNAAGQAKNGAFLQRQGSELLPVALPEQELPGGGTLQGARLLSNNDAGVVTFHTRRAGDQGESAYLWEQGSLTPLVVVGTELPGLGKITAAFGAWVNNKNRTVLVLAQVGSVTSPWGLYRLASGKLTPVVLEGQTMPGSGTLRNIQLLRYGVSGANEAGQHAFLARLVDDATAAYLIDADGRLSLIMKSGTRTVMGTITNVGQGEGNSYGVGLHSQGQVALTVQIDHGPDTVVLLTPITPPP